MNLVVFSEIKCDTNPTRLQPQEDKSVKPEKKRSVDAVVEAYLDEHPAFLDDYVKRKVSRRQLEQWLFLPFVKSAADVTDKGTAANSISKSTTIPSWKKQAPLPAHSSDSRWFQISKISQK